MTALKVARVAQEPGMYADGGGLYLQVTPGGASWVWRYMIKGRAREMGLGPLGLHGLKEARAPCSAQALEGRTCPSRMAQTQRAFDHRHEHQPPHRARQPSEA